MSYCLRSLKILSVVAVGFFSGGMVFIAAAVMPYWSSLAPNVFRATFQALGPYIGHLMIPLMLSAIGLTLISSVVSRGSRKSWGAAFLLLALIVPLYGALHAPINELLLGASLLSESEIIALRQKWFLLHGVRALLGGVAFFISVIGFKKE